MHSRRTAALVAREHVHDIDIPIAHQRTKPVVVWIGFRRRLAWPYMAVAASMQTWIRAKGFGVLLAIIALD
jgi:hypothetical protein